MSEYVHTDTGPFAIVPLWLVKAVSPNALATYALLAAKWANRETNECFPSRKTIGEELEKSTQTVDRALSELEAAGAIKITQRMSDSGDFTSNSYKLFTVQQEVAAPLQGGSPKSEGTPKSESTGGPKSGGTGSPTDEERTRTTIDQNQLEPDPSSSSPSAPKDNSVSDDISIASAPPSGLSGSPGVSHAAATIPPVAEESPISNVIGLDGRPVRLSDIKPAKVLVDDEPDADVLYLCHLLADLYHDLGNTRPNPDQKSWYRACRLLLSKDGPEGKGWQVKQVETIMRWALNDSFWQTNIRSMPKLREQFDQLRGKRNEGLTRKRASAPEDEDTSWMARSSGT